MFGKQLGAFLALLFIQLLVSIVYKYSQKHGRYEYSPLAIIACAEAIKFLISGLLFLCASRSRSAEESSGKGLIDKVYDQISSLFLINTFALAFLYCINNQLAFLLFLSVDPASISLFKSLSSLQSALLLWTFFHRHINEIQWGSIILQVLGLVIVQYDTCTSRSLFSFKSYLMLIGSSLITSFSSVLNEHFLKTYLVDINLQNLVLYFFGFFLNLAFFFFLPPIEGYANVAFFQGYSPIVVVIILCNAFLGITITFVYKYADVIVKTFSTACATGILLFFNLTIFHARTTLTSFLGAAVIFISSYIYFLSASKVPTNIEATTNPKTTKAQSSSWKSLLKWFVIVVIIVIGILSSLYSLLPLHHRWQSPLFNLRSRPTLSNHSRLQKATHSTNG